MKSSSTFGKYLSNKYNLLRLLVLIITLVLLWICTLYTVGSLLTLSFEDFWCEPRYTWNEITSYNRAHNSSTGVGGCYSTVKTVPDDDKLFATDTRGSALIVTPNITPGSVFQCLVFLTNAILLIYVFVTYSIICCIDLKRTIKNEWISNGNSRRNGGQRRPDDCCSCCCYCCIHENECREKYVPQKYHKSCIRFCQLYRKYTMSDTPPTVIRLQFKEAFEIVLQS